MLNAATGGSTLTVLYRDGAVVAVSKPAGLLVHRTGLDAGETRFALQMVRDQLGQPVWPVHRLDKGTSGVLLMALNPQAAQSLCRAFEQTGTVRKRYLAWVRGWPAQDQCMVDHPLRRMDDGPTSSARNTDGNPPAPAQAAVTHLTTLARAELPLPHGEHPTTRVALMALEPLTGRRHQLRRHLKHVAHPILGDSTHGKGPLNRAVAAHLGQGRLWLHAGALVVPHPQTGQRLCLSDPPGPEWGVWPVAADAEAQRLSMI
jgi:tRNA pseudouridine65 synthase